MVVKLDLTFEKSTTLKLISALQISAVLDYGKVYCRRICKGIKTNESCCLTSLFGGHRDFYDGQ